MAYSVTLGDEPARLERPTDVVVALAPSRDITLEDLPANISHDYVEVLWPSLRRDDSLRAWGSRYAALVFEHCGGNKRRACRVLGINYRTLQTYLGFPPPDHTDS